MQQKLFNKLPDFNQGAVLVIGDVMLDRYWFGDTARISPEAPVPIVKIRQADNRPGGAANVALNLSALGCQTTLLGIIGKDEAADSLKARLNATPVNHDLYSCENESTIVKLRVISQQQQLIRLDFEDSLFAGTAKDELQQRFKRHLPLSKLIILSDYSKGTLSDSAGLIKLAHEHKIPVLVDPKGNDFSIYHGADIITPNLKEFEAIVGQCANEQDMINKGRQLMEQHHFGALLITRGADGMTLIEQDNSTHFPAFAREVFDVTGAGDTVIGTLGAAVAAGSTLTEAVTLANQAASLVVSKLGAATVSAPELEAAINTKDHIDTGILNKEQLLQAVNQARSQGKKIVFTNGCFDILHAGHVTYLQHAKKLGDYLIVAVNTDDSIKRLKGSNRPINHLQHRMTVLAGLGMVDWVVPFSEDTPEPLLELIRPDFLAKGTDYRIDEIVGANIVRAYGGEVRIISHNITTSSTKIYNQLQNCAGDAASE